jgi:dienelactone hydrolase
MPARRVPATSLGPAPLRRLAVLPIAALSILVLSSPADPQMARSPQPSPQPQTAPSPNTTAGPQIPTLPLPANLALVAPGADVPPSVARFAGAWARGAWDGVLPHALVVEAVDATGRAQVVYALGDLAEANVTRGYRRVTGQILGDLLTVPLGEGASADYHWEANTLRGVYTSARRRHTVTLARATLGEIAAIPAIVPRVAGTVVRIPTPETGPGGARVSLEATLYRPAGSGPHPVVVFNHGSTGGGTVAPAVTLRPTRQAPFFVERGFAVLAPMRRGRGASDGAHGEYEGTCDPDVLGRGLARALEDMDAAMAYLRTEPWADPARVVIAGQSRGGLLAVAYAAERPGAVRGVINFAGGWTTQGCDERGRGFNLATFATAGGRARVPMLWLYAEQDRFYSVPWIRRYYDGFDRAGGTAALHVFPAFGGDGHRLVDRVEIWSAAAAEFLRRLSFAAP